MSNTTNILMPPPRQPLELEPLDLRQREVIALEAIAKTLLAWYLDYIEHMSR